MHAFLPERREHPEKLLGVSTDTHAKEWQALKIALDKHARSLAEAGDTHATMQGRMNYIEKLLGYSADTHTKELKALEAAHNKHTSDLEDAKLENARHASLPERMEYIEKTLGDAADKRAREIQYLKDAHAEFLMTHGRTCSRARRADNWPPYVRRASRCM